MHRLLEREYLFPHDVGFNKPREGTVHARMYLPGAGVGRVRNDTRKRRAQNSLEIFFVRDVVDHPRLALFRRQQVKKCVVGIFPERERDLRDALSLKAAIFVRSKPDGDDVFKSDKQRDIFKIAARFHPRAHLFTRGAITQALRQRLCPTRLKLRRQHVDELR